ncbi:MAG: SDR family NAD(P)-dependent oxidoreductase, partial [Deltaproteobacteria bacterium]|nr:SDR family NAD(P)-dependent oxidoreductase [Deltaproteobacteria bacterium]
DEIRSLTQNQGVDLVLNSLAGDFIPASLSILASYGRFLEIGKTDIYQNSRMGLSPFQDNLSYFAIDLDRMIRQRPHEIRKMFLELMQLFEQRKLKPLPLTAFEIQEVSQSFRYMAQRKNIGKVIVRFSNPKIEIETQEGFLVKSHATYWVTGAFGGIGFECVKSLVERGAKHLLLMGRSSPSDVQNQKMNEWKAQGIDFQIVRGDVSKREDVVKAYSLLTQSDFPLRGIFHTAGLLEDGMLLNQNWEKFQKVLAPKVLGTLHLNEVSQKDALDIFVLFSSVASLLGSPGQASYAAANAFLDSFAIQQRVKGRKILSVSWGPWDEVGMAARTQGKQMDQSGLAPLPVQEAMAALFQMIATEQAHALVAQIDWSKVASWYPATFQKTVESFLTNQASPAAQKVSSLNLKEEFLNLAPELRQQRLEEEIQKKVAHVLAVDPTHLNIEQALNTVGLDSLMAIELKNEIESNLGVSLSIAVLIRGPSIRDLAKHLVEQFQ